MDHTPHIRLLALVRWQIFINSMEIKSKRENLAAKIVIGLLGISFAGGGALLFGTVAYAGSKGLRLLEVLSVTLWAPFLLWQFVTMLTAAVMQLDYQKISRYPIPFWKFCTLELATGVIDPVAGTALFWLAGAWVGILLGNPSLIPRATLMMVEMAVVSLLISRAVAEYIERWVSTRKGRARFFGVMIALSMLSQFSIFTSSSSWGALHAMTSFKYYGYLPPGLAWNGVSGALLPSIVGLAAYALASGLLLFHRYRLKYQGELHSDGRGEVTVAGVQMGWQFPWLSAAQSAMLEKELRYIFGMPMGTLTFVIGPVTAFFTTFGFVRARHS